MKKILFASAALALLTSFYFTSCKKDDTTSTSGTTTTSTSGSTTSTTSGSTTSTTSGSTTSSTSGSTTSTTSTTSGSTTNSTTSTTNTTTTGSTTAGTTSSTTGFTTSVSGGNGTFEFQGSHTASTVACAEGSPNGFTILASTDTTQALIYSVVVSFTSKPTASNTYTVNGSDNNTKVTIYFYKGDKQQNGEVWVPGTGSVNVTVTGSKVSVSFTNLDIINTKTYVTAKGSASLNCE